MRNGNLAREAAQARVVDHADRWGQEWTSSDLELLKAFGDETVEELALALGRTVYAVANVIQALRDGQTVGGGGMPRRRLDVGWAPDDPRWEA